MGEKYGEKTHILSIAEMVSHAHEQFVTANANTGGTGVRADFKQIAGGSFYAYDQGTTTGYAGGGQSHNVIQPSIVKRSVIKYKATSDATVVNKAPTGTSISGYFTSAPNGYLLEDGSAVSRSTYSDLFAVIGTTYGAGNGSTTFNLPDSRGRVAVNLSTNISQFSTVGQKSGSKTHVMTISELPSHAHEEYTTANANTGGTSGRQDHTADGSGFSRYDQGTTTAYTGGSQAYNIIQPSIVRLYAIKY